MGIFKKEYDINILENKNEVKTDISSKKKMLNESISRRYEQLRTANPILSLIENNDYGFDREDLKNNLVHSTNPSSLVVLDHDTLKGGFLEYDNDIRNKNIKFNKFLFTLFSLVKRSFNIPDSTIKQLAKFSTLEEYYINNPELDGEISYEVDFKKREVKIKFIESDDEVSIEIVFVLYYIINQLFPHHREYVYTVQYGYYKHEVFGIEKVKFNNDGIISTFSIVNKSNVNYGKPVEVLNNKEDKWWIQ